MDRITHSKRDRDGWRHTRTSQGEPLATSPKRRHDREGSVFKRTVRGEFKDFRAIIPVYHPVTDKLIKRVFGYGPTADLAVRRRNTKVYELMEQLGTLTPAVRQRLDGDIRDPDLRGNNTTVAEFAQKWIRELAQESQGDNPTIRQATITTYRAHVDLHIVRHLGDYRLTQLTTNLLTDFINTTLRNTPSSQNRSVSPATLRKQGLIKQTDEEYYAAQPKLSPKTIRHIKTTLNQILQQAVNRGLIPLNPLTAVQFRQEARKQRETKATWGEQILQQLPTLYKDNIEEQLRWHFGVLAGMRQSEVLGLTEDRFVLNHSSPHVIVSQTLAIDTRTHGCGERNADGSFPCGQKQSQKCPQTQRTGLPFIVPFTKASRASNDGVRRIPLPGSTKRLVTTHLAALATARAKHAPQPYIGKGIDKMGELIFTTNNGKPRLHKTDNALWHTLITSINQNIPADTERLPADLRQHTTRRICATVLATNGVPIELAKQLLGHADSLMTEYYTTRDVGNLEGPMRMMDHKLHTGDSSRAETHGFIAPPGKQLFDAGAEQLHELRQADKTDNANLPDN